MAQKTPRGAALAFFEGLFAAPGDECILWPYSRNDAGYGVFSKPRGGVNSAIVSRCACERANGAPSHPNLEAAHTCGRGHLGCVNPRHLAWKSTQENRDDQLVHGTRNFGERNGKSKLTVDQVREMRRQRGAVSQRLLAARFGIDQSTVSDIQRGKRWGATP